MKNHPLCGWIFILSAAPAEAGGSPLCRTPAGGGESVHIFRGRKRVLVLGKVRADGALTQRVSAAGCCTAQSASVPCAFRDAVGCFGHCVLHGDVWWRSLPPAPRSSALRHGPPMPRRGAGVVFEFSSQGVSIPCFGLCVRTHTEGACSLFVHLHLNRECNPCPCRSSRHLGASFPSTRCQSILSIGFAMLPVDFLDWTKNLRQSDGLHFISVSLKYLPYFPSSSSMISARALPALPQMRS